MSLWTAKQQQENHTKHGRQLKKANSNCFGPDKMGLLLLQRKNSGLTCICYQFGNWMDPKFFGIAWDHQVIVAAPWIPGDTTGEFPARFVSCDRAVDPDWATGCTRRILASVELISLMKPSHGIKNPCATNWWNKTQTGKLKKTEMIHFCLTANCRCKLMFSLSRQFTFNTCTILLNDSLITYKLSCALSTTAARSADCLASE